MDWFILFLNSNRDTEISLNNSQLSSKSWHSKFCSINSVVFRYVIVVFWLIIWYREKTLMIWMNYSFISKINIQIMPYMITCIRSLCIEDLREPKILLTTIDRDNFPVSFKSKIQNFVEKFLNKFLISSRIEIFPLEWFH